MDSFLRQKYKLSGEKQDYYEYVKTQLADRPLYNYYAFSLNRDFTKELYNKFGKGCPYPALAKQVKEKYHHLEGMLEGNPAPDISLLNATEESKKLSDYRGKYLYIDCWATWCGPCIAEFPSLKNLEEEYKGKNITFICISFDDLKDKEKWRKFVEDHNLSGVQVKIDSLNKEIFSKAFNIQQIPRFILLDSRGNIINANAPRPSDEKIVNILDALKDI
jgi:thiol-disulfide isomerase/thioredoxin